MKYTTHYTSVEKIVWEFDKEDMQKILYEYLDTNKFLKTVEGVTQEYALQVYEKGGIGDYVLEFTINYEKEEKPKDDSPPELNLEKPEL